MVRGGFLLIAFLIGPAALPAADLQMPVSQAAAKIDGFLESHWSAHEITPAEPASDAAFLRRLTLDLLGRIPTTEEVDRFRNDRSKDKRPKEIRRLIESPEFPLHFGSVLDEMIQGRYSGNADFVDYLRRSIRDGKSWDLVFRELMLGPWDTDESKPANRFLDERAKTLNVLTVDATRVFFGVDISCAKCHDHPLVKDWTQNHFYGMASFFNRTTGGKGKVGEKKDGDVKFQGADGQEQTAKVMFLSGTVIEAPAATDDQKPMPASRREQLVEIALQEREFFSRALVNRTWQYLFGRGLVDPVDQMHSANDPAVSGLLEWLAKDFAQSGYDLTRLVQVLVSTRAYQLSSLWPHDSHIPDASHFAVAQLRPLSRRQLSFSLLLATGRGELTEPDDIESRVERYVSVRGIERVRQYLTVEKQAASLATALDARTADFTSSAGEALFMSNNQALQTLLQADGEESLAWQLGQMKETRPLVQKAIRKVLSRDPTDEELRRMTEWFNQQTDDRAKAASQLLWVLVTSAEFRFNH